MALPLTPNTTCAIYREGTAPPDPPAATGVPGFLRADFRAGCAQQTLLQSFWTHVLLVDRAVDLRDAYIGNALFMDQDMVCIPDANGTRFRVVFIERVQIGAAQEHKRVYLDRLTPNWPTDHL